MVTLGVRGGRPVRWQLLRGVGFTVGLLGGLFLLATAVSFLLDSDGSSDFTLPRRIAVTVSWAVVVGAPAITWRRLRRWSERPRWLVPAAAVLAVAGLTPAVTMRAPVQPAYISHCVPVADAWRPVMAAPSATDVAYMAAHPKPTHPLLSTMNRDQVHAFTQTLNAWLATPAFARTSAYTDWQYGAGSCAATSRTDLGWSAAGLGVGAAALTVAVRRRRTRDSMIEEAQSS